ncbi:MAG: helix-turn-helix transcriptional regulator [Prevotella sp.]|nr:helix-turn-helix transcriptional regulator [Prevotella sp.]MBR6087349.1 helix-turn-helix transcriptional regulator [Prevotella sp.]MBR6088259.1 helix-turn-helix transcriptional regulator [Prevotella sp.]MBR6964364.1 helix-turn-helix transcriptional regulator [Prevotella sp.]
MSDAWLASQIGVSRQTVNYWINGQRDVLVSRLHEVADALNVRVRDLFDE